MPNVSSARKTKNCAITIEKIKNVRGGDFRSRNIPKPYFSKQHPAKTVTMIDKIIAQRGKKSNI